MSKRILFSWIGHTDLRAFAREDASADRSAIEKIAGVREGETGSGPVKALVDVETFDEFHLLSDYPPEITKPFAKWLGCKSKLHQLPPLRERGDDVMLLADPLLEDVNRQFASQLGEAYKHKSFYADTKKFIRHRGNVRELRNAIVQACVMAASDELATEDIAAAIAEVPGQVGPSLHDMPLEGVFSLDNYLGDIQRRFLTRATDESGGVKKKAEELLGFDNYQTLSNRLKTFDLQSD